MGLSNQQLKERIDELGSLEDVMRQGLEPDAIEDPITRLFWREAYSYWKEFTSHRDQVLSHLASTQNETIEFTPMDGFGTTN